MSEDVRVILVVEGPSAAGKTTWCRRHGCAVVAEYAATGGEPDGTDLPAQAAFWTAVNTTRWTQALATEARAGTAVCDTDPLKLHYSWSLARIGAAPRARFDHELTQVRAAFADRVLGFADLILVSIPPLELLRAHRDADRTRQRRHVDVHARLGESLRAWYQALDALEPGRVLWQLPADGLPQFPPPPRPDRSDVALLEELVTSMSFR